MYIFGSHRSYENGDINSNISCYIDSLKKAEHATLVLRIERFLNQEHRFEISKSRKQLAEKREEGGEQEEHRQLQCILRFTQT